MVFVNFVNWFHDVVLNHAITVWDLVVLWWLRFLAGRLLDLVLDLVDWWVTRSRTKARS